MDLEFKILCPYSTGDEYQERKTWCEKYVGFGGAADIRRVFSFKVDWGYYVLDSPPDTDMSDWQEQWAFAREQDALLFALKWI